MKLLENQLPIEEPKFQQKPEKIRYTWIGHSTAVISIGEGINIIIDPVFANRSSPYQWVGPKRFRRPACTVDKLPPIDLVLVSHDHFDHLDQEALQKIHKRFPQAQFVAGLGSADVFPKGCNMTELDWTKSRQFTIKQQKLKVTFVPACHWGRRWLLDRNKRLWGGFVIETAKGKKIYYSGDTGKCGVFEQIAQVFGGFDLSILPIGAYEPRQYLKNQHINPQEAVEIHKILKSKKSVGVHWGTFPLGSEHYTAARTDLKQAAKKQGLAQNEFITIGHGASLQIDY